MKIPKNYKEFQLTFQEEAPNSNWPQSLQALWFAANGNWESSHTIAQNLHTEMGSWIHAHLHRVEGDEFNAGYWYQQAGKPFCSTSFSDEIKEMVIVVLAQN